MAKALEGTLTSAEARLFRVVFQRVYAVLQVSQNWLADAMESTVPGSPNDIARQRQTWDAYEQVGLLMYSAEDHLRAMLLLFEGGTLPTYALYTLLRGAAVPITKCAYLLNPSLTEIDRMARGLNVRLENLIEQNKLKRDDGLFAERVATLEQRAEATGIRVFKKDPARPATDFGERRTSELDLFRTYIEPSLDEDPDARVPIGDFVYRYLSGHVHAMVWVKVAGGQASNTTEPGMASLRLDLQFDWLAAMLSMVLHRHERNVASLLKLSGYPPSLWEEAKKTAVEDAKQRLVTLGERQAQEENKR